VPRSGTGSPGPGVGADEAEQQGSPASTAGDGRDVLPQAALQQEAALHGDPG
jgi:hypothetical protein